MPRDRSYSNMTVNRDDYEWLRKEYDKFKLDETFNTWIMKVAFSAIERQRFINNISDKYVMAQLDGEGFAFLDKTSRELIQISLSGKNLVCSVHKSKPCDHKIFASMHPKFIG